MFIKSIVFTSIFLFFSTLSGLAQSTLHQDTTFTKGEMLLGPHIGLAAFGSAPSFGANFEEGIMNPGEVGPGSIGISGRVDYFSFSDVDWRYTWIAVGVFANYHFQMSDKAWDPFVGLGLGYENVSESWAGEGLSYNYNGGWNSGLYLAGDAGIRYFFSPSMAARAQLGFGITYLVVGLDFRL